MCSANPLWRGGLPPLVREADPKPTNAVVQKVARQPTLRRLRRRTGASPLTTGTVPDSNNR
ncbi:hypothetical protein EMIT0196MI5_10694 [Pseudomonas sp. IT-196MI5]